MNNAGNMLVVKRFCTDFEATLFYIVYINYNDVKEIEDRRLERRSCRHNSEYCLH